jgi:hypothetical protein
MALPRPLWTPLTCALALVLTGVAQPAVAKKPKVSVSIDGTAYRYKGRYVVATRSGVGTIVIATKPARPGKILRTIGFGCAYDLTVETFPLVANPQYCNGTLTEQRIGGSYAIKGWLATSGIEVTYETFDGTWATGTFSGVLDPIPGSEAEGPVTYEGTFRVKVTGGS